MAAGVSLWVPNRRDFNINYNRVIEAGGIVGDEVRINLDIEVVEKKG